MAAPRKRQAVITRPRIPESLTDKYKSLIADVDERHARAAQIGLEAAGPPTPVVSTPRESLERWYANTDGGFDAAVESSQRALKKYEPDTAYGGWPAENVDRKVDVKMLDKRLGDDLSAPETGEALGFYDSGRHNIGLNNQYRDQLRRLGVLDHEMTHALTEGHYADQALPVGEFFTKGPFFRGPQESPVGISIVPDEYTLGDNVQLLRMLKNMGLEYDPSTHNILGLRDGWRKEVRPALINDAQYRASRAEIDPALAEVRRRYAWNTGQDVRTPVDAARALEWYRQNRRDIRSTGVDVPSMNPIGLELLTNPPGGDQAKMRVLRRMTQVPGVLAPLLGNPEEQAGQPPQYFEVR